MRKTVISLITIAALVLVCGILPAEAQLAQETTISVDMRYSVADSPYMEQYITAMPGQGIEITHRLYNPSNESESTDIQVTYSIVQGQQIIKRFDVGSRFYPEDNIANVLGNNYFPFQYDLIPNGTGTIEIRFYDNGTLHNIDGTTRTFSNDMSFSDITINMENPTNVALNNIPLFAWVGLILLSASTVGLSVGLLVMRKKWTKQEEPTQNNVSIKSVD